MSRIEKARQYINSPISYALMFILACIGVIFEKEVAFVLIFAVVTTIVFALSKNAMYALYPAMLLCCISIKCYDSFDTFIKFFYIPIPLVIMIIVKLCKTIKHVKKGDSFYGILGVALLDVYLILFISTIDKELF